MWRVDVTRLDRQAFPARAFAENSIAAVLASSASTQAHWRRCHREIAQATAKVEYAAQVRQGALLNGLTQFTRGDLPPELGVEEFDRAIGRHRARRFRT